jgi:hypothetical protein
MIACAHPLHGWPYFPNDTAPFVAKQVRKVPIRPFHSIDLTYLGAADPACLKFHQNLAYGQGRHLHLVHDQGLALLHQDGRAGFHHSK